MYVCMYVCMYVDMYVCIYVYMYVWYVICDVDMICEFCLNTSCIQLVQTVGWVKPSTSDEARDSGWKQLKICYATFHPSGSPLLLYELFLCLLWSNWCHPWLPMAFTLLLSLYLRKPSNKCCQSKSIWIFSAWIVGQFFCLHLEGSKYSFT